MIVRVEIVNGDEVAQRIAELLTAKLDKITESDRVDQPAAPRQRGSEHYRRDESDPGDGGRRHRGPAFGAVTEAGLTDETGAI